MQHAYRQDILTGALEAREKEVTEYQVNIDNFRLAIAEIGDDPELQGFKESLQGLLASSVLEQRKAQIMLTVIKKQVEQA
ncbi:hypothetical protein [Pararhodobacter sp. CCB-MM2]|uniref:hypothetical protein n=1 Tax=Pararhodobacter sp. CCB-MM2 TaxID=1786003 RepID=UPI00082DB9DA|nr:hypothetical protein [Pararhodobacter sp. CCB-MM2]